MQNRYVGDTGDFGKYLLLKSLCKEKLTLGVNWCLVDDENHNDDGKHISYLKKKSGAYLKLDKDLFETLKSIVDNKNRNVIAVQNTKVLPSQTIFYSEIIPEGTARFKWHKKSLEQLNDRDIIFYDPDNGLEVKSCGKTHAKGVKYVFFDEVLDAHKAGHSIVIYQHTNRSKSTDHQIKERIMQLSQCLDIPEDDFGIVLSRAGSSRFYIIIKQKSHADHIDKAIAALGELNASKILSVYR